MYIYKTDSITEVKKLRGTTLATAKIEEWYVHGELLKSPILEKLTIKYSTRKFIKKIYIILDFFCNFERTKTSDKLSVNFDYIYCINV